MRAALGPVLAALLVLAGAAPALGGTLVTFDMGARGSIQIDLFDDLVGVTVDNFLSYVGSGAYDGTAIHRVSRPTDTGGVPIIQGGGYKFVEASTFLNAIPRSPQIPLQYNRANTRGTISMARSTGLNTASSEWFINTLDNTTTLGQGNNGGYAVFGWIVGNGMDIVDDIYNLNRTTVNSSAGQFTTVPVQNYTSGTVQSSNIIAINSATITAADHPSFQNPWNPYDIVNDGIVKPSDALALITALQEHGSAPFAVEGPFAGTSYVDQNGDGVVKVSDLNNVINELLSQPAAAPLQSTMLPLVAEATPLLVPEPGSLAGAAVGLIAFFAYAARRRRRTPAAA